MTASMFDGSLENYTNKENKPKKLRETMWAIYTPGRQETCYIIILYEKKYMPESPTY